MTVKQSLQIVFPLVIIAISSILYARSPDSTLGGTSYLMSIAIVAMMTKRLIVVLLLASIHVGMLLLLLLALDSIQGSVGGPVTLFLLPPITIMLYLLIFFAAVRLRRHRPL